MAAIGNFGKIQEMFCEGCTTPQWNLPTEDQNKHYSFCQTNLFIKLSEKRAGTEDSLSILVILVCYVL